MISSPANKRWLHRWALPLLAACATAFVALCASALAHAGERSAHAAAGRGTPVKVVDYHGVSLTVPASWPVYDLATEPSTCVRFNRHAVYLGTPGANEDCPVAAIGRTEALLLEPEARGAHVSATSRNVLAPASTAGAALGGGSMVTIVKPAQRVVITATWNAHPKLIRTALHLRSLQAALHASNGHRPAPARVAATRAGRALPHTTSAANPATPGAIYTGLGFDTCTTPSQSHMSTWGTASSYGAVGIYIGGADLASCATGLSAAWVSAESAAGWHLIPIYVGLQAPGSSCSSCAKMTAAQASTDGSAAAQDAVNQAQALGIGTGNPLYFDMEGYTRSTATTADVLAFLESWTEQLHADKYLSGVYSSGASGIRDLVSQYGSSYVEPDELWTASWGFTTTPSSPANSYVPSTDWPDNQQLLQYLGGHDETHGGVKLNIDSDFIDAATAAYGGGVFRMPGSITKPALAVRPQPDGTVDVTPSWAGEPGITRFQILGGNSTTTLTVVKTVAKGAGAPVVLGDVYNYYEVEGLNASGAAVGISNPVKTPPSVAIYGGSAYVAAAGPVGIPVRCINTTPCSVEAALYDGTKQIASITSARGVPAHGGNVLVTLSSKVHRLVQDAPGHRLPVTVAVRSSAGKRVTKMVNMVPYTTSGPAPLRRAGSSSALQIIGKTSFVDNGRVGGVLVACSSLTPCQATITLSRGGTPISTPRTQTVGSGELTYLTYTLTSAGHQLLVAAKGNQLGARVTVTTAPSAPTAPAPQVTSTTTTTTTTPVLTTTTTAPVVTNSTTAPAPVPTPQPVSSGGGALVSSVRSGRALAATASANRAVAFVSLISFR